MESVKKILYNARVMKINTDFVHPEDAPELQKTARKTFLKNLPLRVRAFDNAVIDPNRGVLPPFDAITPPPPR